jgi:tyrosine-protein kinase Etk/Wzc
MSMVEEKINYLMDNQDGKELDLASIFSLMRSYWQWILLSGVIGLFIAIAAVMSAKPMYTADALIQVKSGSASTSGLLGTMGALAANITSQATPAQIQQSLLHSRFILGTVISDLNLNVKITPHYFPLIGQHYATNYTGNDLAPAKFGFSHYAWGGDQVGLKSLVVPDELIGQSLSLVKISQNQYQLIGPDGALLVQGDFGKEMIQNGVMMQIDQMQSRIGELFTVKVSDPDVVLQELSSALVISDIGGQQSSGSTGSTGVLNISLTWPDKENLSIILNKIIQIGAEKNIIQSSKNAEMSLEFINQQIPRIKEQLQQAEDALNQYQEAHHIVDIDDEARMVLTQLSTQEQSLQDMTMQRTLLLQSYTKNHPIILAMNDKINDLQKNIAQTKNQMQNLPSADQKALSLMQDVKLKESIYTSLLQRTEELAVVKAGTIGDITILSLSTPPKKPIPDHASSKIIVGFILGCFLAIFAFIARRILMNVLLSAEEVERKIPVTVQAVLPYCKKILNKQKSKKNNPLIAKDFKDEPIVESIRGLRTNLQLLLATERRKIITILGSTPGIGKTLLSTNLALVLADGDKKVLLIDTDMRRGQAKSAFSIKNDLGLSDFLFGNVTLQQAISCYNPNLDVMTSGTYTTKSNDLLLGSRFGSMLDELLPMYDYIVLDTPPILALSDAILVAKYSSANIFLVGLGKNKADEIAAAYQRFKSNHVPVHMAVCNYCSRVAIKDSAGQYQYYNYEYK